ncbi:hypothetical protein ODJ79_25555 [Actinoplanes sp. KI2]|uniref:hypothetical protein n=1 Tax=Actinoplanes sp. KI2 TaxID=2983315 RepID=UPI0021D5C08F|nr:hypothetical protein [Actinoplanes sp. KI2]MCU7727108.1 hypothetical protein [Actinoplanes sp. KI2]
MVEQADGVRAPVIIGPGTASGGPGPLRRRVRGSTLAPILRTTSDGFTALNDQFKAIEDRSGEPLTAAQIDADRTSPDRSTAEPHAGGDPEPAERRR